MFQHQRATTVCKRAVTMLAPVIAVFVAASVIGITSVSAADKWTARINAGGAATVDSSGRRWSADSGFTGGTTSSTTKAVRNTKKDAVFQDERRGMTSY